MTLAVDVPYFNRQRSRTVQTSKDSHSRRISAIKCYDIVIHVDRFNEFEFTIEREAFNLNHRCVQRSST